ncbi:MAG: hypothetical protein RSC38_05255 [Oscillospiraceae bacterium]
MCSAAGTRRQGTPRLPLCASPSDAGQPLGNYCCLVHGGTYQLCISRFVQYQVQFKLAMFATRT